MLLTVVRGGQVMMGTEVMRLKKFCQQIVDTTDDRTHHSSA